MIGNDLRVNDTYYIDRALTRTIWHNNEHNLGSLSIAPYKAKFIRLHYNDRFSGNGTAVMQPCDIHGNPIGELLLIPLVSIIRKVV